MDRLTDFNIGDKVKLTGGVLNKEYAGRVGVVQKLIKSRNLVQVVFADAQTYDAYPQNVQHVESDGESKEQVDVNEIVSEIIMSLLSIISPITNLITDSLNFVLQVANSYAEKTNTTPEEAIFFILRAACKEMQKEEKDGEQE